MQQTITFPIYPLRAAAIVTSWLNPGTSTLVFPSILENFLKNNGALREIHIKKYLPLAQVIGNDHCPPHFNVDGKRVPPPYNEFVETGSEQYQPSCICY